MGATLTCTFKGYHNLGGSRGAPPGKFWIFSIPRSLLVHEIRRVCLFKVQISYIVLNAIIYSGAYAGFLGYIFY